MRCFIAVAALPLSLMSAAAIPPQTAQAQAQARPPQAAARDSRAAIAARPELFSPDTGLRIDRYRAPTPNNAPLAVRVDVDQTRALAAAGATLIDVMATRTGRYDEFDGVWLGAGLRETLPGAVWLPEIGRGSLTPVMRRYFADALARLTNGDHAQPVVFFCVADCWMSWNAAQRAARLGYGHAFWFREGTDGWLDQGETLQPVAPTPIPRALLE